MRTSAVTHLPGLARHMEGRNASYVARKLGMDISSISQLVSCKRGASLAMALRLATYFGTSVEDLASKPALIPA